jgi:hypothetical protein
MKTHNVISILPMTFPNCSIHLNSKTKVSINSFTAENFTMSYVGLINFVTAPISLTIENSEFKNMEITDKFGGGILYIPQYVETRVVINNTEFRNCGAPTGSGGAIRQRTKIKEKLIINNCRF